MFNRNDMFVWGIAKIRRMVIFCRFLRWIA